jgi:hypothetical protein
MKSLLSNKFVPVKRRKIRDVNPVFQTASGSLNKEA